MFDQFIPQPWPLYAVTEDLTGGDLMLPGWQLVIGWIPHPDEPDSLVAVVAGGVEGTAGPVVYRPGERIVHLFADIAEAGKLHRLLCDQVVAHNERRAGL